MRPGSALVSAARRELAGWTAPDGAEHALQEDYLTRIEHRGADAVFKHGGGGEHLTASCVAFDTTLSRVLLTHHRKGGFWVQFGGHLEPDDASVAAAAQRELREESGVAGATLVSASPVQLNRHGLADTFGDCRIHLDVVFAAVLPGGARPTVSAESLDVAWFDLDALPPGIVADLPARLRVLADRTRALI